METYKFFFALLAIFLHRGNCRAITSNNNDGFGDEVVDTILREEFNQQEKSGPTGIPESDKDILEGPELFSDDVIPPMESVSQWRHKRSPDMGEPGCYSGRYLTITLSGNRQKTFPICKNITSWSTACTSSMQNNNNQRRCQGSRYLTVNGTAYAEICTCA